MDKPKHPRFKVVLKFEDGSPDQEVTYNWFNRAVLSSAREGNTAWLEREVLDEEKQVIQPFELVAGIHNVLVSK